MMEDTSCQVECPTVPKSCIVVNSTKKIPERKVPKRDGRFVTSVPGIYLIGDVSGVPLIKNAINEGGAVIDYVVEDIKQWAGTECRLRRGDRRHRPRRVVGGGARRPARVEIRRLEQDQVAATIQQTYQAGKYIYYNPVDQPVKGGIKLDGGARSRSRCSALDGDGQVERRGHQ